MQSPNYDRDWFRDSAMAEARRAGALDGLTPAMVCELDAVDLRELATLQLAQLMVQA